MVRHILLLVIYSFLTACSSFVDIDFDNSINFSNLKTYSIQSKPVRVSDDTRINSPFMRQRVLGAISNSLAKKGFDKADKNASIQLKYYLDVRKDFETEESFLSLGFGTSGHHSALGFGFTVPVGEVYSVDKLVLTIDVFSRKSNKLIWRGSLAQHLASGSTPATNTLMIDNLVAEILNRFPPK